MVYRFFLYNLKYPGNADRIGKNLETNFLRDPADGREAAKQLVSFDTEAVVARLSGMLGGNAIVLVNHPPKGMVQTSYIRVVTSYVKADEVYHKIMAAACEFNLAYYDPQSRKSMVPERFISGEMVKGKSRARQVVTDIRSRWDEKKIWRMRHIYSVDDWEKPREYYVITLRKPKNGWAGTVVTQLHSIFLSCLKENEELLYEDKGFTFSGDKYSVTFYIEGFKKHANQIWYVQDSGGRICHDLIYRMGYVEMEKWLETADSFDRLDTLERLQFNEWRDKYKNVLDRLAASIKLTKRLNKIPAGVHVDSLPGVTGRMRRGCDGLSFHALPGEFLGRAKDMSCLNINEDGIMDFFDYIHDLYPHVWDRYYDTTHYPIEVLKTSVERLKKVRPILLYDPESKVLREEYWHGRQDEWVWRDMIERRHEIIELIDVFCEWAEDQLHEYTHNNGILVIKGP